MTIRLSLLCHAPLAEWRAFKFPIDEPADAAALADIAAIPAAIGRFVRLLAAPEQRTRQTADTMGSEAAVELALRDVDFGSWRGRTLDDIQESDPHGVSS